MKKCRDMSVEELREWVFRVNGRFQEMRSFVGVVPMPALIKDSAGRVLHMNPRAEAAFGVKLADVFGAIKYHRGEAPATLEAQDRKVINTKKPGVFFNSYTEESGKVRHYSVLKILFTDDSDNFYLVCLFAISAAAVAANPA